MSQTYLCKNLGVEVGGERLFEGGVLAGDYGDGLNLRKLPGWSWSWSMRTLSVRIIIYPVSIVYPVSMSYQIFVFFEVSKLG